MGERGREPYYEVGGKGRLVKYSPSQSRSGLNGRKFTAYKFRTMVADAESKRKELEHLNETDGPVFKIKNDPRIIPYLSTFLRKA